MGQAGKEVEIKLSFDSAATARRLLESSGARVVMARTFEDNVLYDRESSPLKNAEKMLRLRRVGPQSVLTYKAPVAGERSPQRHKVRIEHETQVGDARAVELMLDGLDFKPAYRYQKYRTKYELDGLEACLDETPIGCFVELEGAPDVIDRVAERLGFSRDQYICTSYRELHEESAGRTGEIGDMVFDPASD